VEPKTVTAFRWSAEELFRTSRKVYFWTFTLKNRMPAFWVPRTWDRLHRDIIDFFGKFRGVRVFEWHKQHGLHVHALVNCRMPIHVLRRIGARYGFGVMWVKVADANAPKYLAKYLGKDFGKMPNGGRSWSCIGGTKGAGSRVRQVKTLGDRADFIRSRMAEYMALRTEGAKVTQFQALRLATHEWETRLCASAVNAGVADSVAYGEEASV